MLIPMLITLISLALIGLFLYRLLSPREIWDFDQAEGALTAHQKRRDGTLSALKDIEYEHEAGTLRDEEFFPLRQDLKRQAVAAMKDLDRVRAARLRGLNRRPTSVSPSLRRRVEALVSKRKEAG